MPSVAKLLKTLLGTPPGPPLQAAIRAGLPAARVTALAEHLHLSRDQAAAVLGMAPRTLNRRLAQRARLTSAESDRLVRVAQVAAQAAEVLGDEQRASAWLRSPNRGLRGAVPLDELDTGPGTREVENILGRIAFGGYS